MFMVSFLGFLVKSISVELKHTWNVPHVHILFMIHSIPTDVKHLKKPIDLIDVPYFVMVLINCHASLVAQIDQVGIYLFIFI